MYDALNYWLVVDIAEIDSAHSAAINEGVYEGQMHNFDQGTMGPGGVWWDFMERWFLNRLVSADLRR